MASEFLPSSPEGERALHTPFIPIASTARPLTHVQTVLTPPHAAQAAR